MGVGTAMPALVADLGARVALCVAVRRLHGRRRCSAPCSAAAGVTVAGPRVAAGRRAGCCSGSGLLVAGTAGRMAQLLGRPGAAGARRRCAGGRRLRPDRRRLPGAGPARGVRADLLGVGAALAASGRRCPGWSPSGCPGTGCSSASCRRAVWRSRSWCRRSATLGRRRRAGAGAGDGRRLVVAALGAARRGRRAELGRPQQPGVAGVGGRRRSRSLVLVPSMRRLLPRGVFRARARDTHRRGVPRAARRRVLHRQLLPAADAAPAPTAGRSPRPGSPLVVGSLGWSSASAWQGRHPDLPRPRLLRIGFCALAIGPAGLLLVAPSWGSGWLGVAAVGGRRRRDGPGVLVGVVPAAAAVARPGEVGFNSLRRADGRPAHHRDDDRRRRRAAGPAGRRRPSRCRC